MNLDVFNGESLNYGKAQEPTWCSFWPSTWVNSSSVGWNGNGQSPIELVDWNSSKPPNKLWISQLAMVHTSGHFSLTLIHSPWLSHGPKLSDFGKSARKNGRISFISWHGMRRDDQHHRRFQCWVHRWFLLISRFSWRFRRLQLKAARCLGAWGLRNSYWMSQELQHVGPCHAVTAIACGFSARFGKGPPWDHICLSQQISQDLRVDHQQWIGTMILDW